MTDTQKSASELSPAPAAVSLPWESPLCAQGDLPVEGAAVAFDAGDRRIAVFCVAARHYAVDDSCTHGGSSLAEDGRLLCGAIVECGLHRAQFNLENGAVLCGPTRKRLRSYRLTVKDGAVTVRQILRSDAATMGQPGAQSERFVGGRDG